MDKLIEAGYISVLGQADKAGRDAVIESGWTEDNWFPCGSGKVVIKPWNSKFARWLIENDYAHHIKGKGVIWGTHKYNQAMNPQITWASAAANKLREFGVDTYMWSYID